MGLAFDTVSWSATFILMMHRSFASVALRLQDDKIDSARVVSANYTLNNPPSFNCIRKAAPKRCRVIAMHF